MPAELKPQVTATANRGELKVTWDEVEGAAAYRVYFREKDSKAFSEYIPEEEYEDENGETQTRETPITGKDGKAEVTLDGLKDGTTYYVWVKIANEGGALSGYSQSGKGKTKPAPGGNNNVNGANGDEDDGDDTGIPATSVKIVLKTNPNVALTSLELVKDTKEILVAVVEPEGADSEVYWRSSLPSVVNVDTEGMVTGTAVIKGLAIGRTSTIKVLTVSGKEAECAVMVKPPGVDVPAGAGFLYKDGTDNPIFFIPDGNKLYAFLAYIAAVGADSDIYEIVLAEDETLNVPYSNGDPSKLAGVTITIKVADTVTEPVKLIKNFNSGSLLTLSRSSTGNPLKFILGDKITITTAESVVSTAALITIGANVQFEMLEGSRITGNNNAGSLGGGGVYVTSTDARFTMKGGSIDNNTSTHTTSGKGGGVCVSQGTFIMEGGKIHDNTATSSGGGVYNQGTFNFEGGEISGNKCSLPTGSGGGVCLAGNFTMGGDNGEMPIIKNNEAAAGGGVYAVYTANKTALMKSGKIYGNKANAYGGAGLYVGRSNLNNMSIQKTGGIIYGTDVEGADSEGIPYKNCVAEGQTPSHAVHAIQIMTNGGTTYRAYRDSTAGDDEDGNFTVDKDVCTGLTMGAD